jgi:hypothetical protein
MSKALVIDFLYLDLEVCQRCQGTEQALSLALSEITKQLKHEGYEITLHKINVKSLALAHKHRFLSSPTIRVNGRDLTKDLKESLCEDCGTLCGDQVDCRVWIYQGQTYTTPPSEMIKEAILNSLNDSSPIEPAPYECPSNLIRYFEGLSHKQEAAPTIHLKHL